MQQKAPPKAGRSPTLDLGLHPGIIRTEGTRRRIQGYTNDGQRPQPTPPAMTSRRPHRRFPQPSPFGATSRKPALRQPQGQFGAGDQKRNSGFSAARQVGDLTRPPHSLPEGPDNAGRGCEAFTGRVRFFDQNSFCVEVNLCNFGPQVLYLFLNIAHKSSGSRSRQYTNHRHLRP
jgi:hypothetical protein